MLVTMVVNTLMRVVFVPPFLLLRSYSWILLSQW